MTSIFEQPWSLLIASLIVLLGVFLYKCFLPQKHKWWFWLFPLVVAISAFAIDYFVQTDTEKVRQTIARAVEAVEEENSQALEPLISDNYSDSFHSSKQALLNHCRVQLSEPVIEENILRIVSLNVEPPVANAVFTVRVVFDQQGPIYEFAKIMLFKLDADFQIHSGRWVFSRVEILEINLQPANWQNLQASPESIF